MRGFLEYIRRNGAGVLHGVPGSTLYVPFSSAWDKLAKSSLVHENDFQTASTSLKELGEQRLRAQIEAMVISFRLGPLKHHEATV